MGVSGRTKGVFSSVHGRLRLDMSGVDQDALSEIDNTLQIQNVSQQQVINKARACAKLLWKEMIGLQNSRVLG
jgi:hypothetical protein